MSFCAGECCDGEGGFLPSLAEIKDFGQLPRRGAKGRCFFDTLIDIDITR